jgi:copper chaperone NosL
MNAQLLTGGVLVLAVVACGQDVLQPASLDTRNDACARCRMMVSEQRFASQVVAPGEEAKFFDDLGCLRGFLKDTPPTAGAIAYVADYRTGAWTRAARAVYVRHDQVQTPMGSHLLAFADAASRDAGPEGKGTPMSVTELFGPDGPPDGAK